MTPTSRAAFREYNSGILRARYAYATEPFALSKHAWTQHLNGLSLRWDPRTIQAMRDEVASW